MIPVMPESSSFVQRLGALLRAHRGDRTQVDVAGLLGISDSTYSDYERGVAAPSLPMLLLLLDVLGIQAADIIALLEGHHDDEPNGVAA